MDIINFKSTLSENGFHHSGNRAQCPGHNGKKLSMAFDTASNGNLLVTCHSHKCSIDSIAKGLGISVKDFFQNNESFNKTNYKKLKSRQQIDTLCINNYRIITLATSDVNRDKNFSEDEKSTIINAMRILDNNNFSHSRYKQLMHDQAFDASYRRFNKKLSKIKSRELKLLKLEKRGKKNEISIQIN